MTNSIIQTTVQGTLLHGTHKTTRALVIQRITQ